MEDEPTNKTDTTGKEPDKPLPNVDEPLSIVDEAKKVRDEIKAENDRREEILKKEQKLESDKLLGGGSGGHVEPKPKEETDEEFVEKVKHGEANLFEENAK